MGFVEVGFIPSRFLQARPLLLGITKSPQSLSLTRLQIEPSILSSCVLFPCSVVGPALTFRIRPNNQNLSAEDVADKAGELHEQCGVRLVRSSHWESIQT